MTTLLPGLFYFILLLLKEKEKINNIFKNTGELIRFLSLLTYL